jgi:hypothetical protein
MVLRKNGMREKAECPKLVITGISQIYTYTTRPDHLEPNFNGNQVRGIHLEVMVQLRVLGTAAWPQWKSGAAVRPNL